MKSKLVKGWIRNIAMMLALLNASVIMAQDSSTAAIDMADKMRAEGKIYVVVLVVAIVFTGLIIFAVLTDRKVSSLERQMKSMKSGEDS